jgi:hypothetical protein
MNCRYCAWRNREDICSTAGFDDDGDWCPCYTTSRCPTCEENPCICMPDYIDDLFNDEEEIEEEIND